MHEKTLLLAVPLSLGLRSVFPVGCHVEYYLSMRPRYFFVHAHSDSDVFLRNMQANGCGGFANTGLMVIFVKHLTLDFFGEYSYKRLHFHSNMEGALATRFKYV